MTVTRRKTPCSRFEEEASFKLRKSKWGEIISENRQIIDTTEGLNKGIVPAVDVRRNIVRL